MAMNATQLQEAEDRFKARLASLRNDVNRCFCQIAGQNAPGPALFPALMYCFATVDYFSSFWLGWNASNRSLGRFQTDRMRTFLVKYLGYPKKEVAIALDFWRDKLMHTSEPRVLTDKNTREVYNWLAGARVPNHMQLHQCATPANHFELGFSCMDSLDHMDAGVLGPSGYLTDLKATPSLQQNYLDCSNELDSYEIDLSRI